MSRSDPKPFWWNARQCYYLRIDGKSIKLSPDKDEAYRQYYAIMASRAAERKAPLVRYNDVTPVLQIFNDFLGWSLTHNVSTTHYCYRRYLVSLAKTLPSTLMVRDFSLEHFDAWIATHRTGSHSATRRGALIAVKRAMNWGMRSRKLTMNPFQYVEVPPPGKRTLVITEAEFAILLSCARPKEFHDLLRFCWLTGARAMEVYILQWEHVKLEEKIIVLPKESAKGKKHPRTIVLCNEALELLKALPHREGHLFRTPEGSPYNSKETAEAFERLRYARGLLKLQEMNWQPDKGKLDRLLASGQNLHNAMRILTSRALCGLLPKISITTFRHTFCTRALKAGMNTVTVAELMGHTSTDMVSRVYQHLGLDKQHLHRQLDQLNSKPKVGEPPATPPPEPPCPSGD